MRFINLGVILLIIYCVNCQDHSPLAGQDYILRSCISTAELIRTHRKAGKDEKMITTNAVGETSEGKTNFLPLNRLMTTNIRGKRRKIEETPLRTLNILRGTKNQSPLLFNRKRSFPEISNVRNRQQKREKHQRESEVIIIKLN